MDEEINNKFLAFYCCVLFPLSVTCIVFFVKATISYNDIENFECDKPLDTTLIISWVLFCISLIFSCLPKSHCLEIKKLHDALLTPSCFIYNVVVLSMLYNASTSCGEDFIHNYTICTFISTVLGGTFTLIYLFQFIACTTGMTDECYTLSDFV